MSPDCKNSLPVVVPASSVALIVEETRLEIRPRGPAGGSTAEHPMPETRHDAVQGVPERPRDDPSQPPCPRPGSPEISGYSQYRLGAQMRAVVVDQDQRAEVVRIETVGLETLPGHVGLQ